MTHSSGGNLPFELSSFVGRVQESDELGSALSSARLVSIIGPGGAGKSRLAKHVAGQLRDRFPDGVWLIELDELRDERLLADLVLSVFGIPGGSGRTPEEALIQWLEHKRLLVVLDDCENLLQGCRQLVTEVMTYAPEVTVLATTRQPLAVDGERVWRIPPLSVPGPEVAVGPELFAHYEALTLFEQRARAARRDFTVTEANAPQVAELCRRLDGSPLALELAAVQLRVLTVGDVLDRLDRPFSLLQAAWPGRPRRQSLRAVVEASHDLCTPAEREVWACASVFAGSFDLEAARDVCAPAIGESEDYRSSLDGLVDKSVLTVSENGPATRYRMLETIRRFGAEKLDRSGDAAAVRRRHRDHYLRAVRRGEAEWSGPHQAEMFAYLRSERANLRVALDFCFEEPGESATGVAFVGLLWPLWIVAAFLKEASQWVDRASSSGAGSDPDRLRLASVGTLVACLAGDIPRARQLQNSLESLEDRVDDPVLSAIAARAVGTVEMVDGKLHRAAPHLERSVALLREAGRPHSLALVSHADLGVVYGLTGAYDAAVARCEEGRALCTANGEGWALSWILFVLSFVRIIRDENDDASRDLEQMLRIKRDFDDVLGILHAAELLAWLAAGKEPARAARILGANEALWRPFGQYLLAFEPYLARHDRCVVKARELLGDARFDACYRAGAGLDLAQLAAYALGEEPAVEPAGLVERAEHGEHGLTRREREICGLVAQGLTDRQIAERLVISPRTVQTHVANILGKLAFRSRAELATWTRAREPESAGSTGTRA